MTATGGQAPLPAGPSTSRCRNDIGRADLVLLLERLGFDAEAAAALTGFEQREAKPKTVGLAPATPVEPRQEAGPADAEQVSAPALWRAINPRVTVLADDDPPEMPAPIRAAALRSEQELAADPGFSPPRPTPLLRRSRLVPLLRRMARVARPGRLDEVRLVAELAKGSTLRHVPRRVRWGWPARLQLYWDVAAPMQPCWYDQHDVASWLRRWHGEERLEEIVVDDSGRARSYSGSSRGRGIPKARPVRPPDSGTLLLVLGDLGAAHGGPSRQAMWQRRAALARRAGAECRALLLCPAERLPGALARAYQAAEWERAKFIGARPRRPISAERRHEWRERLLTLLSEAVRIEPGLLRAARLLLPRSEADLGTELDVWMDERIQGRSRRGLTPDRKAMIPLQARFAQHPEALRRRVCDLIDAAHAGLSPLIRGEDKERSSEPERRREGLRSQAEYVRFLLSRGGDLEPSDRAYLDRFIARHSETDWQHRETAALWGIRNLRDDRSTFTHRPPPGLPISEITWLLQHHRRLHACRLWQSGSDLWLLPLFPSAGPTASLSAPPLPKDPGSHFLDLRCSTPLIKLEWHADPETAPIGPAPEPPAAPEPAPLRSLLVTLTEPTSIPLPVPKNLPPGARLHIETDRAHVTLVPQPRPDWADALLRRRDGLSLDGIGTLPVAGAATDPLPWPPWATRIEKDRCGLLAEVELAPNVVLRMRWIPPGTFTMGSPKNELERDETEGPAHQVTLTRGYWMSETPCTQAEWRAVMETDPSHFKGAERPVEQVGWDDCVQFCERLHAMLPGFLARLPTEAEWEYACRAGTRSAFNDGSGCTQPSGKDPALMKLGWFDENGGGETHPVRQLQPNAWGLYDMHGNVREWCSDWWPSPYESRAQTDPVGPDSGHGRVIRGGSFGYDARLCRSAYRFYGPPGYRYLLQGFRFVSGPASGGGEEKEKAGRRAEPPTEHEDGSDREASGAEPAARGRGSWWKRAFKK